MKQNQAKKIDEGTDLLKRAEEQIKNQPTNSPSMHSGGGTKRLLHELQVHQVELEIQNEELIHSTKLKPLFNKKAPRAFFLFENVIFCLHTGQKKRRHDRLLFLIINENNFMTLLA